MLGRHHLMLSLATGFTVLAPFIGSRPDLVVLILAGIGIGSLIPDSDAGDAAIFHESVKGLDTGMGRIVNGALAPTFPVFGYTNRYFIYRPAVYIYNRLVFKEYQLERHHRGFMHSLLGIGTSTALTGAYLAAFLSVLGLLSPVYLTCFLLGYVFGGLMHLLEDSCTKTGIKWNYPFSDRKLKGRLRTTSKHRDTRIPHYFFTLLGITAIVSFTAGNYGLLPHTRLFLSGTALAATAFLWMLFLLLVARVKLE